MKTLRIPYIDKLEKMSFEDLDLSMEINAAKGYVSELNWKDYPYAPTVAFRIARSQTHLAIMFNVRGLDLRAAALDDNGPVWEDSCCEFFVSDPADGTYYNFETNCIGTLLASKRRSRNDADMFTSKELDRVLRYSSLEKKSYDSKDKIFCWSIAICIPFDLIGIDSGNLPESIRANFYKCGDMTAHPHFLSWNRIDVPSPDFHRPEFFGELLF